MKLCIGGALPHQEESRSPAHGGHYHVCVCAYSVHCSKRSPCACGRRCPACHRVWCVTGRRWRCLRYKTPLHGLCTPSGTAGLAATEHLISAHSTRTDSITSITSQPGGECRRVHHKVTDPAVFNQALTCLPSVRTHSFWEGVACTRRASSSFRGVVCRRIARTHCASQARSVFCGGG